MSARLSTVRFPRGQHSPMAQPQAVTIAVDDAGRVSGLLQVPHGARACYVLAHGAGAGMSYPFMAAAAADGLAERGIATMRYQFPCRAYAAMRAISQRKPIGCYARLSSEIRLKRADRIMGSHRCAREQTRAVACAWLGRACGP
jgi:hypothetical protein